MASPWESRGKNVVSAGQLQQRTRDAYSTKGNRIRDEFKSSGSSGGGGGSNSQQSNKDIADKFNIGDVPGGYGDKGGTIQDFQKDLAKAAQYGLFVQHPYTKALMDKYGLDTQDVINLRLGTGSGGVGRADPSKLYNRNYIDALGDVRGNRMGVFQKLFNTGMFPMAVGPGNLGQEGIGAFREGMTVYDYPPPQNWREQLGQILGSRFNKIAGGSPTGINALSYGRNELGYEGDQLNKFASALAGNRDLYNTMMTQPYMVDKQLQDMMYGYQRTGTPERDSKPAPVQEPTVAGYNAIYNPYLPANYDSYTGISAFV